MTFYYPKELFDNNSRWHIFPLLKSLLKEGNYSYQNFSLIDDKHNADYIIIPMSWNFYYTHGKIDELLNFCKSFQNQEKLISFVFGDFGVKVPEVYKGIVFRTSGNRSKLPSNHVGMPVFIDDPIKKYYPNQEAFKLPFFKKPIVGFCGQARPFGKESIKEFVKVGVKNMLSFFGHTKREKEQLISTSYLRWRILKFLQQSNTITSNFIIRSAYRAGVTQNKQTHPTTIQFYNNIKGSYYTVCLRGAGNFSTRFYETLAMGRIPLFINTDCLLPLDHIINWKEYIVWADYKEKHLVSEKVTLFHQSFDQDSLQNQFMRNRKFWEEHLQLYSFFNHFFNADKKVFNRS